METFTLVVLLWAAFGEPWSMRLLGRAEANALIGS